MDIARNIHFHFEKISISGRESGTRWALHTRAPWLHVANEKYIHVGQFT